jgi:hypothetical protein
MKSNSLRNRRLELEQMEDRRVMAGFVQAAIHGGDLVITGDSRQNEIAIYKGTYANQVVVSGIETGNGPTRVNGKLLPVVLNGFTGSIVGNMKEGSDKVLVTNLNVPGNVALNGHKGNDQFAFSNGASLSYSPLQIPFSTLNNGVTLPIGEMNVHDSVFVNLGDGDDNILLVDTDVGNDVVLHGQAGNDNLHMGGSGGSGPTVLPNIADNLLFFPGSGDDVVFTDFLTVGGLLEVHDTQATFGSTVKLARTSVREDLNVYTSPYNDVVQISANVRNLNAHMFGGNDDVRVQLERSLYNYIHLGEGDDTIVISESVANHFTLDAGAGQDTIFIGVTTDRWYAYLGDGDDFLALGNSTVKKSAYIHGGTGDNTYRDFGGNDIRTLDLILIIDRS